MADYDYWLAGTHAVPQPDPNDSLSGRESTTTVYDLGSTLTGIGTDGRSTLIDTTQIASPTDWTEGWLIFESGAQLHECREITAFDDGTGTFTVYPAFDAAAAGTEDYRIYMPNGFFSALTTDHCSGEIATHRLAFIQNVSGVTINGHVAWVTAVDPGPVVLDIAEGKVSTLPVAVDGIAEQTEDPDIGTASNFVQSGLGTAGTEVWKHAESEAIGFYFTPVSLTATSGLFNLQYLSLFVRVGFTSYEDRNRIVRPPSPLPHRAVYKIHSADGVGGHVGVMLIVVDIPGVDRELAVGPDRALRLGAGARVEASVTDSVTGAPVDNLSITIEQTVGPGTLGPQSADTSDDSGNPVRAVYLSPTDEMYVGDTVTFRIEVN